MVNPHGLSTYSGQIETDEALASVFDVSGGREATAELTDLIGKVTAAGHALTGADDDRAVFSCYPGLGSAQVEDAGQETGVMIWSVIVHHPAMGRGQAETHLCENTDQVLEVLSTVSYG